MPVRSDCYFIFFFFFPFIFISWRLMTLTLYAKQKKRHRSTEQTFDYYFKTRVRNLIPLLNCCDSENETRSVMSDFL